jgi:hypothetical protein
MMDQYGGKKELCDGLAALPQDPTPAQRIRSLAAIVAKHYGPTFAQAREQTLCRRLPPHRLHPSLSRPARPVPASPSGYPRDPTTTATTLEQDCFYDSECVKNVSSPAGPSQLGGLNSRSWRFEKCSEVAYLQAHRPPPASPTHRMPAADLPPQLPPPVAPCRPRRCGATRCARSG